MPEDASDDELLTAHDAASFERFYFREKQQCGWSAPPTTASRPNQ